MKDWGWLLALLGGVAAGVLVTYVLVRGRSSSSSYAMPVYSQPVSYAPIQKYVNEEVWTWKDWRGRDRKLVVSREAKISM